MEEVGEGYGGSGLGGAEGKGVKFMLISLCQGCRRLQDDSSVGLGGIDGPTGTLAARCAETTREAICFYTPFPFWSNTASRPVDEE